MPQTTTVFRILLSSPSDMMADRDAIEEAIEEVSRDLAPSGMTLNTVRWERDSFPGKGTDTQAVVGNQILKDYDILIALIGRRLGTQTPRAESGTVEEIEHAIKKDGSAFENHHIQVFFKEVQISIHNVDIEEISRVRKFRESLGDRGVLYRDFKDAKQLQSHVRGGLKQALRSWESNRQTVESTAELANQEKTSNASQNQNNAIEDIGVLDYLEMHEEGLKEASEHLDHSSKRLESFATYLSKITVELSILNQADANAKKRKTFINEVAKKMKNDADFIYKNLTQSSQKMSKAIGVLSLALEIQQQDFSEDIDEKDLLLAIDQANSTLKSVKESNRELIIEIDSFPRLTSEFNKAKRRMLEALDMYSSIANQFEISTNKLKADIDNLK